MKRINFLLFLLLFASFPLANAQAQWQQTSGPYGAYVTSLIVNDSTMYAGTEVGIFRSTDLGGTWIAASNGLGTATVKALTAAGSTLFAGTSGDGIYRSLDSAGHWIQVKPGLTVTSLCVQAFPYAGTTIFAGTYDPGGVFASTDNGSSWHQVDSGLTNSHVMTLTLIGTTLYAGTDGGGVFRSDDFGKSWVAMNGTSTNPYISVLLTSGTTLYAGSYRSGWNIARTTDGGFHWTRADSGLFPSQVNSMASWDNALFAGTPDSGIFCSTDSGASWREVNEGLKSGSSGFAVVEALLPNEGLLFAGLYDGVVWRRSLREMVPLVAPERIFPPNGMVLFGQPKFSWHPWDGASRYHLQWSADPSFQLHLLVNDSTLVDTSRWAYPVDSSYHGPFEGLFYWRVRAYTTKGWTPWSDRWSFSISPEDVQEHNGLPKSFSLEQNYPNPFNPTTTIRYATSQRSHLSLIVYNMLGQRVATLVDGEVQAGYHEVQFSAIGGSAPGGNAAGLASGVYFYRLQKAGFVQTRKLLLVR
jgi:photosystem II stability/assembly factor-like uncharacterized protein